VDTGGGLDRHISYSLSSWIVSTVVSQPPPSHAWSVISIVYRPHGSHTPLRDRNDVLPYVAKSPVYRVTSAPSLVFSTQLRVVDTSLSVDKLATMPQKSLFVPVGPLHVSCSAMELKVTLSPFQSPLLATEVSLNTHSANRSLLHIILAQSSGVCTSDQYTQLPSPRPHVSLWPEHLQWHKAGVGSRSPRPACCTL